MINIITTIAQNPEIYNFHLSNIKWAFSNFNSKICIQTFKEWGLKEDSCRIYEVQNNPYDYYRFYDNIFPLIACENLNAEYFVFLQQDMIFYRKVDEKFFENNSIKINFFMPQQYTIYNCMAVDFEQKKIIDDSHQRKGVVYGHLKYPVANYVYPRIWEGCTVIPSKYVMQALKENISFGHKPKRFSFQGDLFLKNKDKLSNYFMTDQQGYFRNVAEYICSWEYYKLDDHKFGHDTMFEFMLYAFCESIKCSITYDNIITNRDWLINENAIHFHWIEKLFRETKGNIIDDYRLVFNFKEMSKDVYLILFIYYLIGVLDFNKIKVYYHLFDKEFIEKICLLDSTAIEWMPPPSYKRFLKIKRTITF